MNAAILLCLFVSLSSLAATEECALDSNVPLAADMIETVGKKEKACVLNVVCGGSPKTIYCKSPDGSSCPSVEDCYATRLDLSLDSKQPNLRAEEPKKEGEVKANYLDAPVVLGDGEGSAVGSCVGDARFAVREKRGVKVGVAPVVCGAIGRTSCPSAMTCAKDKSRGFSSTKGSSPTILPSAGGKAKKPNVGSSGDGKSGSGGGNAGSGWRRSRDVDGRVRV